MSSRQLVKLHHFFQNGAHKVTIVEPYVLDRLYQILSNYDTYREKLDQLKHTLQHAVKPSSVMDYNFI